MLVCDITPSGKGEGLGNLCKYPGLLLTEQVEVLRLWRKDRVTKAARRLGELEVAGVELREILGGQAGATFIRDGCDGDPEVAYAAIAHVY